MSNSQTCRSCKKDKPLTLEFFDIKKSNVSGFSRMCKSCKNEKGRLAYKTPEAKVKQKLRSRAYYDRNKEKVLEMGRRWRAENQEMWKRQAAAFYKKNKPRRQLQERTNRLLRYGLSLEAFDVLLKKQSGLCAICSRPMDRSSKLKIPHVDHNHLTGKVRSLLCGLCNSALGLMQDSPELLRIAAEYLDEHNGHA